MVSRPVFQHQGPDSNCVIAAAALGWKSCTAYSMAMLIDAATDGAQRPKGCRIRRLVRPEDITKGLNLSQVAAVAEGPFGLAISVRTGANAIAVEEAVRRIRRGRGFVLQGNNSAWGLPPANHAVYVHEVRGGPPGPPTHALLYDPQRRHERWVPWRAILDFGAALTLDDAGLRPLGPGRLYAGFAPRPAVPADQPDAASPGAASPGAVASPPAEAATAVSPGASAVSTGASAAPPPADGVALRFGARRLPRSVRRVAAPPAGRLVNVRRSPRSLSQESIVDTLGRGEVFVAFQKARGATPAGARSSAWLGNRDATEWVHVSGLRRIPRPAGPPGMGFAPGGPDPDDDLVDLDDEGPATNLGDWAEGPADADELLDDVLNDDLGPLVADPSAIAETSDPDPDDEDADVIGTPLTDAEIAALEAAGDAGPGG